MTTLRYTVTDPLGLHARPAGMLVKKAKELGCKVMLAKGEKTADAAKMFAVMGLSVKGGDEIVFTLEGDNEAEAAQTLEAFLKENL